MCSYKGSNLGEEDETGEGVSKDPNQKEEENMQNEVLATNGYVNPLDKNCFNVKESKSTKTKLDSTIKQNNQKVTGGANFFEGVEKLLEVWFTRAGGCLEDSDLRNIPR